MSEKAHALIVTMGKTRVHTSHTHTHKPSVPPVSAQKVISQPMPDKNDCSISLKMFPVEKHTGFESVMFCCDAAWESQLAGLVRAHRGVKVLFTLPELRDPALHKLHGKLGKALLGSVPVVLFGVLRKTRRCKLN